MHPDSTVTAATALAAEGLGATEIGRRLGVSQSTVQYWCRGGRSHDRPPRHPCPRCDGAPLDEEQYVYLLGVYLGDGHILERQRTAALALSCADDWPGVRAEARDAVAAVMPSCRVSLTARTGCHAVTTHSKHWLCLFPQHGPGTKHTRSIVLASWQRAVVERHPERLVRGLFHSDGCRNLNWARKTTPTGSTRYEYVRYLFSNRSEDIMGICESALDLLGVPHRRPRPDMLSVARREGVARLEEIVGPKY